jgi:hypothetical protein
MRYSIRAITISISIWNKKILPFLIWDVFSKRRMLESQFLKKVYLIDKAKDRLKISRWKRVFLTYSQIPNNWWSSSGQKRATFFTICKSFNLKYPLGPTFGTLLHGVPQGCFGQKSDFFQIYRIDTRWCFSWFTKGQFSISTFLRLFELIFHSSWKALLIYLDG